MKLCFFVIAYYIAAGLDIFFKVSACFEIGAISNG